MPEKHALNKDTRRAKETFQTEVVRMTEDAAEAVKQIEIECGLSAWSIKDYRQEILRKDSIALISKNDGLISGFMIVRLIMFKHYTISLVESAEKEALEIEKENEAEIYNIAVKKQFQKQGIGQRLLDNFLSCAKEYKISKVWLEVRESNHPAIRFYLKNKFLKAGTRKNFYHSPPENALVMSLDL